MEVEINWRFALLQIIAMGILFILLDFLLIPFKPIEPWILRMFILGIVFYVLDIILAYVFVMLLRRVYAIS